MDRLVKTVEVDPDGHDADGTGPLESAFVTTYGYDAVGNLAATTDANGHTTTHAYDARNRLVASTDPDGGVTAYRYDADDNLLSLTDPLGHTTTYTYDARDRLLTESDPLGSVTSYVYDAADNLIRTILPDPDGDGPLEAPEITYEYDDVDRLVKQTDPLGDVTTYEYDKASQLLKVVLPDPDDAGPLTSDEIVYTYDDLGRLTSETDPNGDATDYTYDLVGNLLSLTDASGNTTAWTYDDLDRTLSDTNELGGQRSYVYDVMNRVVAMTDRNGRLTEYDYDDRDLLIAERWIDGAATLNTINYAYDDAYRLTSVSDAFATYTFTYDENDRLVATDTAGSAELPDVVLTNAYDIRGLRIGLSANIDGTADFANTYGYDDRGFLTSLTQSGAVVAAKHVTFAYDDQRRLTSLNRFADATGTVLVGTTAYAFDDESQLTSLTHSDHTGSATLHGYTFTYDDRGRLTGMTSPDGTVDYAYDDAGQLTGADHSLLTDENYAYDDTGNRETVTNSDGVATYAIGDNNRLLSDGTYSYEYDAYSYEYDAYSYEYDAEGNRTAKIAADGSRTEYGWDHRNRLVSATFKDALGVTTKVVEYVYDAFDRRIGKRVDETADGTFEDEYRYVYDSDPAKGGLDDIVLTFDGADNVLSRHLHGPGLDNVLAVEDASGDVQWALTDHLGSVRGWAAYDDLAGTTSVTATATFDSYGILMATTGATPDIGFAYGYTGQEWDADVGLSYFYARWYDPTVGRFVSEDPIGFGGGDSNKSRYVRNSPAVARDSSGLEPAYGLAPDANPGVCLMKAIKNEGFRRSRAAMESDTDRRMLEHFYGNSGSPMTLTPEEMQQLARLLQIQEIIREQACSANVQNGGDTWDSPRLRNYGYPFNGSLGGTGDTDSVSIYTEMLPDGSLQTTVELIEVYDFDLSGIPVPGLSRRGWWPEFQTWGMRFMDICGEGSPFKITGKISFDPGDCDSCEPSSQKTPPGQSVMVP